MKHIKLAVIADDFTGGADAASFLKRKHANVVLLTGIPQTLPDCRIKKETGRPQQAVW